MSIASILEATGSNDLITIITHQKHSMGWEYTVCRMEEDHQPQKTLCTELPNARPSTGRPKLHFRVVSNRGVDAFGITVRSRETRAYARGIWG